MDPVKTTARHILFKKRPISAAVLVLSAVMIFFFAFQMAVSLHKYNNLEATTMDLGYFEQVFWKISHGDWWAFSTVFQTPALAADGSLWVYPVAYGFRYLGGVTFLFCVQSLGTSLSAWGLYKIARVKRFSPWQSAIISMAFLLYPAIIGGSQFDYHPDFIALPLIVWAYFFYATNRATGYYVCLLLAVVAKNVVLISLLGWGFGLIFWKRRYRDGLVILLVSAIFFIAEMDWIIPMYFRGGTESINLSLYSYLGHGFVGIIEGFFMHLPAVLHHLSHEERYVIWVFLPVLTISLFGTASVPAMLALFFLNALSSFAPQQMIDDQYQVILTGWVFLALIEGLRRFEEKRVPLFLFGITIITVLLEAVWVNFLIVPELSVTHQKVASVKAVIRHIPNSDVVFTQNHLGVFAYRFRDMGVANAAIPGLLVDPLPTLWNEHSGTSIMPTALLGMRPTSPYFADVLAQALAAGYHMTLHQQGVFLITGDKRFPVPSLSRTEYAQQPTSNSMWTIPVWTQKTVIGLVDWSTKMVVVPKEAKGLVFSPITLYLSSGTYDVGVMLGSSKLSGHPIELGTLHIARHELPVVSGRRQAQIKFAVSTPQVASISLTSTGASSFTVEYIFVKHVKHNKAQ